MIAYYIIVADNGVISMRLSGTVSSAMDGGGKVMGSEYRRKKITVIKRKV
jgi:hypothetical protein